MNCYKMKTNQKSPSNSINIKLSSIDEKNLKSAKMAVRYGYSYRKIAQLHCHNSNYRLNLPIALKRYHRSVVSGTIIALRAVPPVSL